ncbi:hypothetical protein YC2023_110067 [Brassica napus]
MDPWFLLKLIPVKNFFLSSDLHHRLSAWERNDGEMERRRIDGELTEMEAVARDRLSKTDFGGGGEKPTKERDTLRCGPVVARHVGILTKPKNTNLSSGPLFSFQF